MPDAVLGDAVARHADAVGRRIERLGLLGLAGLGVLSALLLWMGLSSETPFLGLVLPTLVLVALGVALARPGATATFIFVMVASLTLLAGDGFVGSLEILFGVGAMAYLAAWFARATMASDGVLRSATDVAAAAWCVVGIGGGCALGVLFGGDAYDFRADLQAALFFPFYFPVKEVVRKAPHGPRILLAVVIGLGLFAAVVNMLDLRSTLQSATKVYEIVDARAGEGMMQVSAAILTAFALLASPRARTVQLAVLSVLAVLLVGLVVGKSRAYWVAVVLGVGALGVLLPGADRRRLVVALVVGAVGVGVVGVLLLGDQLALIGAGAIDRLLTLGSGSRDLSLANRFVETQAALDRIVTNPVLGHGWGTQVTHYSLVSYGTMTWAFLHNGYVALWFKLGVWGLGLMVFAWLSTLARSVLTVRFRPLPPDEQALLAGVGASLTIFLLTAATSNPFSIMDQMLTVAILFGAANGVVQRGQDRGWQPEAAR